MQETLPGNLGVQLAALFALNPWQTLAAAALVVVVGVALLVGSRSRDGSGDFSLSGDGGDRGEGGGD